VLGRESNLDGVIGLTSGKVSNGKFEFMKLNYSRDFIE